jgi:succinyl-diaminopimelate desuccinylase
VADGPLVEFLRARGEDARERRAAQRPRPRRERRPDLILCGHCDTKPPGDLAAWRRDPYSGAVEDGELHGLGSGDMKGALAAIVFAVGGLAACGPGDGSVALVLTADEEAGSRLGARWLAESGRLAGDAALIGEPCGIEREWEAIGVVACGVAGFRVRVRAPRCTRASPTASRP